MLFALVHLALQRRWVPREPDGSVRASSDRERRQAADPAGGCGGAAVHVAMTELHTPAASRGHELAAQRAVASGWATPSRATGADVEGAHTPSGVGSSGGGSAPRHTTTAATLSMSTIKTTLNDSRVGPSALHSLSHSASAGQ